MQPPALRIGVDLGGTKIEALALGPDGTERARRRVPTPQGDYAGTVATVADLVHTVERELGASGTVGIGTPGSRSPATGLMRGCNSVVLNGKPLKEDLEQAIGRPIAMANDADCFALSEASDGAGQGAGVVFGVILGTGVGGGVAVNGEAWRGNNRLAGEWGHNPFPSRDGEVIGSPCYCGRNNCIETVLSGPALVAAYHDATAGENAQLPEIEQMVADGDPVARAVLSEYIDHLGNALATVIGVLDPEVIVIGGGVSSIGAIYRELPERVAAHMFHSGATPPRCTTSIVKSKWGPDSGVRGAARLWPLPK
jgi:fructokinase